MSEPLKRKRNNTKERSETKKQIPNGVPRRPRNTPRAPIRLERLAERPWRQILNNTMVPESDDITFIDNKPLYIRSQGVSDLKKEPVTDKHLIVFMRLVDTMHDITERELVAKQLSVTPTSLTKHIQDIYGSDYAQFYKSFAEVVMRLVPKEYNNIKVIKSRLYNYVTRLSPSKFNDGRRVEFQYDSKITTNRLSNITPVLLDKLMRTMNDSRFVVDATKYSLNTDMRLDSVKRSNRQLLTFSQLIDPSTISSRFDKYLLEIQDSGHIAVGDYVFAYIYSFIEMKENFDYFYIMDKSLFQKLRNNGNVLFLDQYLNRFSVVCFRNSSENKTYAPFLNVYVLQSNFLKNMDNTIRQVYRKLYNVPSQSPVDVYKSPTFTTNKLSIENLIKLSGSNKSHLHIGLEYKRSFDSLQMHYQAYLNRTTDFVKFRNQKVSDEHRMLWNLFHNSTIISFDILSGLFGYLYGANVMIEYRGTYRMYSIDQSSFMRDKTIKQQEISDKIEFLRKAIESTRNIKNTVNLPNTFQFSNTEKKVLQNAARLSQKEFVNHNNIGLIDKAIQNVNQIWIRYQQTNTKLKQN